MIHDGKNSLNLKKINVEDAYAQWQYTTNLPEDENGLTNPYHGVSYDEYVKTVLPELISYEHPVNMPDWFVPETYFYLWDGDKLVGEFRIRHYLTEALRNGAGHIGYSISKEYRGKGYGTEGLRLTLEKAREIVPESEIFLRVLKDNLASQNVMIKNDAYRAGEDEEHFFMRIPKVIQTEQFLTLMADFDEDSQKIMGEWYEKLKEKGFTGTQTKGLPFHISLGSFALDKEQAVIQEMNRLADTFATTPVHISHIGVFAGGRVLFCGPDMNPPELLKIRNEIKVETTEDFPWTPHATILCDETEVICKAMPILLESFHPFMGKITKLHLCAFWPTREIATVNLKLNDNSHF